jgi:hypothetical protein
MRIWKVYLLGLALVFIAAGSAHAAQLPALPQAFIDTTYSPPSGNTITVNAGGNLQTAINNAQPGDTIVLEAGATFSGSFTLPVKSGSGWIYIRSSAYASLPPPGTRVSPADAANMPKIVGPSNVSVIQTASQAHNYRFVGIEFRPAAGQFITTLIKIGNNETSVANLPRDITFDRCYVHGDPTVGGRRGIAMNGASIAVVDSYVSDFKDSGADSQALWTYNSPGPLKIVNNYLEAAAENFMSGGGDPDIANLVPSDIEIRRNHFFKPLAWMSMNWVVKNLIEFKNARRVLVEGNIFENVWRAAQVGALVNAGPSPEGPNASWTTVEDLTFRYNKGINLEVGFQINGRGGDPYPAQIMNRVLIEHNVLQVTRPNDGDGTILQIGGGPVNVTIRHNTALITVAEGTTALSENIPAADQFDFRDNLLSRGDNGFLGTSEDEGVATLNAYYTNYTFIRNAIISAPSGSYPADNFFPANTAAVGFVDYANGNYRLSASSPLKNQASDGTDVGADIDAVEAVIAGSATTVLPPRRLRVIKRLF